MTRELHEPQIFQRASKCIECSNKAAQLFKEVLENKNPPHSPEYYRARNILREADKCFQETLAEARRFMGPLPSYTSEEYLTRREHLLEEFKILIMSEEYDDLKAEIMEDEHIRKWIDDKELDAILPDYFDSQKEGKRKLANIKVRILIDKLKEFLAEAHRIQKEVLETYHSP